MESAFLVTTDERQSIPRSICNAKRGPPNVDGECILGGEKMPAGLRGWAIPSAGYKSDGCVAFPVFIQDMVPYTSGKVVGSNYEKLKGLGRMDQAINAPFK